MRRTCRDTATGTFPSQDELTARRGAYATQHAKDVDGLVNDFLAGASDIEVSSTAFHELIMHMMSRGICSAAAGSHRCATPTGRARSTGS